MSKLRKLLEEHKDLLRIHVELAQLGEIDENLYDQLIFSEEEVMEHIECQAGMMAWWTTVCRTAEEEYAKLQHAFDMWFAMIYEVEYDRLWKELDYKKSSKPNISSVENHVKLIRRKEYNEWQRKLRKAKKQIAILKDCINWWQEKGQMLVQAAKYMTAEMNVTDIRIGRQKKDVEKLRRQMSE